MIVVWHVGSARLAFRRGNGIEGSLSAVECAAPVPEEFAGAAVQRTGRPILIVFKSGQLAGHRPVDFAVILLEMLGIVGHPVENDELGHWYLLVFIRARHALPKCGQVAIAEVCASLANEAKSAIEGFVADGAQCLIFWRVIPS